MWLLEILKLHLWLPLYFWVFYIYALHSGLAGCQTLYGARYIHLLMEILKELLVGMILSSFHSGQTEARRGCFTQSTLLLVGRPVAGFGSSVGGCSHSVLKGNLLCKTVPGLPWLVQSSCRSFARLLPVSVAQKPRENSFCSYDSPEEAGTSHTYPTYQLPFQAGSSESR